MRHLNKLIVKASHWTPYVVLVNEMKSVISVYLKRRVLVSVSFIVSVGKVAKKKSWFR